MAEEIFDVVNERDEVIDRKPRSEVHRLGLLHRAIHVLIYDLPKKKIFLQKRSMKKDRQPGLWGASVSGHVDAGEDYDTAAVREVREEIGLKLDSVPERIFRIDACEETEQEFVWIYVCQNDGPFELNQEEIDCGGWFTPAEVSKWLYEGPEEFTTAFRHIWKMVMNGK
jgi:isopentenyldiphosphate isomerase